MATQPDQSRLKGSLSIFFSASVWGLFWIPLRYFDESGLQSLWAVAAINGFAALIGVPVAIWYGEFVRKNLVWLLAIGIGMGTSNVLYFAGIILSDVVRVVFLFYLLPIWATLFSWLFFKVPISKTRLVAIAVAIPGIWLLLGGGGWPIPKNIGDTFGLLSGMGWALGLAMIRGKPDLGSFATSAAGLVSALIIALLLGVAINAMDPVLQPAAPKFSVLAGLALPLAAFGIIVLWPTIYGQLWGAKFVAATTAALLTMSEIVVATISTTVMIGSELNVIAWFGGGLILLAILIDLYAGTERYDQ